MKNWILFHRSDIDGHLSGAIVKMYLDGEGEDYEMVGLDYGDEFDEEQIKDGDKVYMVDFTLQPYDRLEKLNKRVDLIVYDHHKSAEEALKEMDAKGDYGEGERAGCKIVWENLIGKDVPEIINLLSDHDNWNDDDKDRWESKVEPFEYAMQSIETDPMNEEGWKNWEEVFKIISDGKEDDYIKDKIIEGNIIVKYKEAMDTEMMQDAFELEFEGLKFLASNGGKGSKQFDSTFDPDVYDAMLSFRNVKNEMWTIGLYGFEGRIDLSEIAKKHGGGGHKDACGFQTNDITEVIGKMKELKKEE